MSELTDRQYRLLREHSPEGRAFRDGALCEALVRNAATLPHRDLIQYVRALAEFHPEMTSGQIARTAAKVFYEGDGVPT